MNEHRKKLNDEALADLQAENARLREDLAAVTGESGSFTNRILALRTQLAASEGSIVVEAHENIRLTRELEAAKKSENHWAESYTRASRERTTAEATASEAMEVFAWLQGESGSFPIRQEGQGAYYWRKELRRRVEALRARSAESGETPDRKGPTQSQVSEGLWLLRRVDTWGVVKSDRILIREFLKRLDAEDPTPQQPAKCSTCGNGARIMPCPSCTGAEPLAGEDQGEDMETRRSPVRWLSDRTALATGEPAATESEHAGLLRDIREDTMSLRCQGEIRFCRCCEFGHDASEPFPHRDRCFMSRIDAALAAKEGSDG